MKLILRNVITNERESLQVIIGAWSLLFSEQNQITNTRGQLSNSLYKSIFLFSLITTCLAYLIEISFPDCY